MKKVIAKRPDIAFYIKLYPLPMHEAAYGKSITIVCEKSIKLLEDNFAGKKIPEKTCEFTEVDDNIKLAQDLGINGAPALIFPDGTLIPGFMEADKIIKMVSPTK